MFRLAVISTHPIQYNAPFFQLLAREKEVDLKVFYTWEKDAASFDEAFGKKIEWDIPLLSGYNYEFVSNNGKTGKSFFDVKNPGLNKRLKEWNADAILVYGWNYKSHLDVMRYWKGKKPVWFRGDSTLLGETGGWKTIMRRLFLKWIYSYVDLALYVGKNNKEYFLKHGLKENELVFMPHAVDNDRFSDPTHAAAAGEWKKQLNLPKDKIIFLYAGKLDVNKDPLTLIESFKASSNNNKFLLMVGNGRLEEQVKAAISGEKNIMLIPFQNQSKMPLVYRLADVYILPSKGPVETWGLGVNEAMASGLAVVASDICGCADDLIQEGVNGYTFRAGDKGSLVQRFNSFHHDETLAAMKRASSKIIENWSYASQVKSIKTLLRKKV